MQKRNYQKELDTVIKGLEKTPTLLLHSCCAPCSSYVLKYLSEFFEITVYYYNPNITEKDEYHLRTEEVKRLITAMHPAHPIHFLEGPYEATCFFETAKGHEKDKEGGVRCRKCFELRLNRTAEEAAQGGFDYFTTTLTISPLKNADVLNEVGETAAKKYGAVFLPSDFKKKNGYLQSIALSKEYELYRQDYCGCIYSKMEREAEKASHEKKYRSG